jgi:hypothetical protein
MKTHVIVLLLLILILPACKEEQPGVTPAGVVLDTSGWLPFPLSSFDEMKGTALDMSWLLDAPAGKHGFLTVKDDKFFFEDGREARFWGGNIFGEANFPEKEEAERIADIIARSGANIIRMHHLDVVKPWTDKIVQRSFFGGQQPETTRKIDPEMFDKFFYIFHCLKQRGIYIFLSHISSRYVMRDDAFPGNEEALEDVGQGFKVEGMYDPYLIKLQQEYLFQILSTNNPYTGLALKDDPALALIEIINENSLFWLQPDGGFGINSSHYRQMLEKMFTRWLASKYGDEEALIAAWTQQGKAALLDDESLHNFTIKIPHIYIKDEDWPVSGRRKRDTYRFLYDLQNDYYQQMYRYLRNLDLKIPIAGSNHWCRDVADLQVNAHLDYIDRHDYWTHPIGEYNYIAGQGIQPKPMVKDAQGGNIGSLAQRRVFGKPYTISEWHNPLPNPYRAEGTPIMAAYACLQDWHPMQYAYWGAREQKPDTINSFEVMFDPTQMNLIPISALLFHRRDFKEAERGYFEIITPEQVYDPSTEIKRHPEVAFLGKYGLSFTDLPSVPKDNDAQLLKSALEGGGVYTAKTGEITWNMHRGIVILNSGRTQGIIGFISGETLKTDDIRFNMKSPFGVVIVSSLTEKDLVETERILISTAADARMTGVQLSQDFTKVLTTGRFPFLMQPVEGEISLKIDKPITIYALSPGGTRMATLKARRNGDRYIIELSVAHKAMHYEIVKIENNGKI